MKVGVRGVSVWGPGLAGWAQAQECLQGKTEWVEQEQSPPPASILAPNERRRSGPVTRLAMAVASEACTVAGMETSDLSVVFASANGDGGVIDSILRALSEPGGEVSPTQFHNSVHNAPAGYWTIGHNSIAPATALGCYDWSFGLGLLKAASEAVVEQHPVLFVAYDQPIPGPIGKVRVTKGNFACALLLDPNLSQQAMAQLNLRYVPRSTLPIDMPPHKGLQALAADNPAARSLSLLTCLAQHRAGTVRIACQPGQLEVDVSPC
ncbi:hypothetical protein ACI01nite_19310 [Acetobacter cibinongensis]|uniref:Beta-ketoacyl synthase-like N-terminal domain-containing protein n=1 Tax=Acetobacter cibinongensis TaxID=146475 RepID=A0A0D6N2R3_9PROT|nr:beta-ketoacyl synthase chain length factor [Acetobacter cibinongensis]GAN59806.1 hypothetical protein Abci_007_209 [Acetobacter cibinongensis]GBQ14850.1 beta-ketoacyl synthase domain protein [Acetobacter cibinongensis NRIC 0482]GEL59329.1 hypothetical protein ACI01nite_19310 [Acetobacter cibinongensis]